ncbi:hypothetical protein NB496_03260 [Vibrio alginolyticus]|uniref:hypothetical protein n=1 Tax=Vibrio harveyi group TaxID=717610 RepID=UPI00215BAB14|nr:MULTISPECIES: hypothetical protein [Vibrio harveyi group]MCR9472270.1 hypothetical protein [Vibrio diabolicus]MCR9639662.1 hypothetical protein [Vibrio alginolyticus]
MDEALQESALNQEEKLFIGGLDEEFIAPDESQNPPPPAIDASQATAMFSLNMVEGLLKQFGHHDFAFDESQKENTAAAIAPALAKYNGELPPWLEPYKEEVFAVIAVGTLGITSYMQIKALKALDKPQSEPQPEVEASADAAD